MQFHYHTSLNNDHMTSFGFETIHFRRLKIEKVDLKFKIFNFQCTKLSSSETSIIFKYLSRAKQRPSNFQLLIGFCKQKTYRIDLPITL